MVGDRKDRAGSGVRKPASASQGVPTPSIVCPVHGGEVASICLKCGVRQIGMCAALDDGEIADLEAIMTHRRLDGGQTLIVEGDEAGYAYNVLSGGLKLYKSLADGRMQITGLLLAGDFLGLPPRGAYATSAEALDGTALCQLPRKPLQALFAKYARLEERLLTAMYDDWAAAQEHMLLLGRKSAKERLGSFLVALLGRLERAGNTMELLVLPMHRGEIGDYLGLSLETVSRSFSQLRRDGIIELITAERVAITDRSRLEAVAAGD